MFLIFLIEIMLLLFSLKVVVVVFFFFFLNILCKLNELGGIKTYFLL